VPKEGGGGRLGSPELKDGGGGKDVAPSVGGGGNFTPFNEGGGGRPVTPKDGGGGKLGNVPLLFNCVVKLTCLFYFSNPNTILRSKL
jgi:hypothetical protein